VSDVDLTPAGKTQGERLAAWALEADLDAVWTSPLRRAVATAEPVARALRLPIAVEQDLSEVDFGMAEGHRLDELPSDVADAFRSDPVAGAFPGAENPASAAARGVAVLRQIARQHPGTRTLIVSHSTLLRLVLCRLLGIPLHHYRTVFPLLLNCAPTEVRLSNRGAALLSLNVAVAPDE
jgi:2,3-bisphosphoglycerate-dependent phosphoglycerate mutase